MRMLDCPYCGKQPVLEQCEPWPSEDGPAPWYVGCYGHEPEEHFIGGNADESFEAIELWGNEVIAHTDAILADLIGRRIDEPKSPIN